MSKQSGEEEEKEEASSGVGGGDDGSIGGVSEGGAWRNVEERFGPRIDTVVGGGGSSGGGGGGEGVLGLLRTGQWFGFDVADIVGGSTAAMFAAGADGVDAISIKPSPATYVASHASVSAARAGSGSGSGSGSGARDEDEDEDEDGGCALLTVSREALAAGLPTPHSQSHAQLYMRIN